MAEGSVGTEQARNRGGGGPCGRRSGSAGRGRDGSGQAVLCPLRASRALTRSLSVSSSRKLTYDNSDVEQ